MTKSVEELRARYASEFEPAFAAIQQARETAQKKTWVLFFILFPVLGTVFFLLTKILFLILAAFVCAAVIALIYYQVCRREQTVYFKDVVLRRVLVFVAPEMSYDREKYIPLKQFKRSGIYTGSVDRYRGEDCFFGKYEGVDLVFSEVHAEEKHTTTDSKGNRESHYDTIFKGVFFIADFNKDFRTSTYVIPGRAGIFGRLLSAGRGKVITLESPEFARMFTVYAQDAIEARYILTPNIMERMIAIQRRFPGKVAFAFHDSSVYIAIPSKTDFFEIPRTLDFAGVSALYAEFALFFDLVHELNLTLRIWTKT
ncbi:MAG: DUF3137 domain-containing protein [Kiritimatiellaeota bacterium]|nr:DUF3137 domain-containing protein [Kiritimatiellota bacterium]